MRYAVKDRVQWKIFTDRLAAALIAAKLGDSQYTPEKWEAVRKAIVDEYERCKTDGAAPEDWTPEQYLIIPKRGPISLYGSF